MLFARVMFRLSLCVLGLALIVGAASEGARAQQSPVAFEVDEINPGLADPTSAVDRSTPVATLEAFLIEAKQGNLAQAAHLLDLSDLPIEQQRVKGPQLAAKLAAVIDRKIPIDFAAIPDRPDAMVTVGSNRQPMVGEPRKSIRLGTLQFDPWPVSIRLNRLTTSGSDPVWLFSRQTVEHVDALYERYGPTALERVLPEPLRATAFYGVKWWEVIALPIVLGLAAGLGAGTFIALTRVRNWVSETTAAAVISRLRLPLVLAVTGVFLHLMLSQIFVFSAAGEAALGVIF